MNATHLDVTYSEATSREVRERFEAHGGEFEQPIRVDLLIRSGCHRPDLSGPKEIADLVATFYKRVESDDLLGPVFVRQARVNWTEHLPKITAFWCKLEHGMPGFNGAPTQKHNALSSVEAFRAEQFERWVALFHDTVDSGWAGPHAESIKARAVAIAKAQSMIVVGAEQWNGPAASDLPGL